MRRLALLFLLLAPSVPLAAACHDPCPPRPRCAPRACRLARACLEPRPCAGAPDPFRARRAWRRCRAVRIAPLFGRLGVVFAQNDPVFHRGDVRAFYDGAPPAVVGMLGERYLIDSPE